MKHVIVIGGGIIGLSCAYYLRRAGHRVTVIDKGDLSDNCSYGNAGYICPSHFIPLATPGIVWKGLKWMFNSRSPFYIRPSLNPSLIRWGTKFVSSATKRKVEASAVPLRDIAKLSQDEYADWDRSLHFGYQQKGLLEIFQTSKIANHAAHTVETSHKLGLDAVLLDQKQLQALEPQVTIDAIGAILFRCDSHVDPGRLMRSLIRCLQEQQVSFQLNTEVSSFDISGKKIKQVIAADKAFEPDDVVLAAGAWSPRLASLLQLRFPMMPGRGYSYTAPSVDFTLNHPAILVERRVAITPFPDGRIRFGGTMEVVPVNTPPHYQRMSGILQSVKRYFPGFTIPAPAQSSIWYGYRPCSADGLPYIGRSGDIKNIIVATGHGMLGLSLGAGTGKLVSELVNEQPTGIDMKAFAVDRFNRN